MRTLVSAAGRCSRLLSRILDNGQSAFLLTLRVYWGARFVMAGWGKLHNIDAVAGYFSSLQIPMPLMNAYAASLTELIGGAMLLLGFASRIAAIPLIATMLVALATAHRSEVRAIFSSDPSTFLGALPLTYLMAAMTILFFGPGKVSVDHLLEGRGLNTAEKRRTLN